MASISTSTLDSNGVARVLSDDILDARFFDVSASSFANPDASFTGYASNGFWYTAGSPDPVHSPFKAYWAQEGEGDGDANRGPVDAFPDRLLVLTTTLEVVLLNADTLDVWMRFIRATLDSSTYGTFLGRSTTEPHSADFADGVLVIATSLGTRVVDFRQDGGYLLLEGVSYRSSVGVNGIAARNTEAMIEAVSIPLRAMVESSGLRVRLGVGTLDSQSPAIRGPFAAVGHTLGLSIIHLPATYPEVKAHHFTLSKGSWSAFDDGDGDGTTPYVTDAEGDADASWVNPGVKIGDTLILSSTSYTITDIDVGEDRLSVTPEIAVGASDVSYSIHRRVPALVPEAHDQLFIANGMQAILRLDDTDTWLSLLGGNATEFINAFQPDSGNISLAAGITTLYDLAVRDGAAYAATDIGVFYSPASDFERTGAPAGTLLYAAEGTASYLILAGGFSDCRAVAIDPETGHLAVAATNGSSASAVTEIDASIHQAYQFTTLTSVVRTLLGFRNASGPPDQEVV